MKIIEYAKNGTTDYVEGAVAENDLMLETERFIASLRNETNTVEGLTKAEQDELIERLEKAGIENAELLEKLEKVETENEELKQNKSVGTAEESDVLEGKTFSNSNGVGLTGTMIARGTLDWTPTGSSTYTVEPGFYTGGTLNSSTAYNAGYNSGYDVGYTAGASNLPTTISPTVLYGSGANTTLTGGWTGDLASTSTTGTYNAKTNNRVYLPAGTVINATVNFVSCRSLSNQGSATLGISSTGSYSDLEQKAAISRTSSSSDWGDFSLTITVTTSGYYTIVANRYITAGTYNCIFYYKTISIL